MTLGNHQQTIFGYSIELTKPEAIHNQYGSGWSRYTREVDVGKFNRQSRKYILPGHQNDKYIPDSDVMYVHT